jgi:RecJ-like exonuclease
MKTCPDCNGDGVIDKGTDDEQRCPTCGGLGVVPDDDDDGEEVIRAAEGAQHLDKRILRHGDFVFTDVKGEKFAGRSGNGLAFRPQALDHLPCDIF